MIPHSAQLHTLDRYIYSTDLPSLSPERYRPLEFRKMLTLQYMANGFLICTVCLFLAYLLCP